MIFSNDFQRAIFYSYNANSNNLMSYNSCFITKTSRHLNLKVPLITYLFLSYPQIDKLCIFLSNLSGKEYGTVRTTVTWKFCNN